jgi:hypothetical protein
MEPPGVTGRLFPFGGNVKVLCKLPHEWGEKVFVNGQLLTISREDGTLDVDEETAALLLQNKNKYRDPSKPEKQPSKKPARAGETLADDELPPVVLKDPRTGRELSDEETREVLRKAQEDAAASEPAAPVDDAQEAAQALGQANGGIGQASAGEQAATDPLAAQLGADKAAEIDQAINDQNPERPEDGEPVGAEDPPNEDWPEVSMKSSKADLEQLCMRLEAAGFELERGEGNKRDLLEAIESAYDLMAEDDG